LSQWTRPTKRPAGNKQAQVGGASAIGYTIGIPLLAVLAIIQSTVLPHLSFLDLTPNLVLVAVLAWSFQRGPNEGLVWAWVGGMLSDLASGAILGISALPLIVAALITGVTYRRLFHGNVVLSGLVALFANVVFEFIYLILLVLTRESIMFPAGILRTAGILVLIHTIGIPLGYLGTFWLVRIVEGPRLQVG
jgi:rod shape-determining protein MreD